MKKEKNSYYQYLPLYDAAKRCPYSQEYLSLRARQGKLKAVKKGRNWLTTEKWLNEYIKNIAIKEKKSASKALFDRKIYAKNLFLAVFCLIKNIWEKTQEIVGGSIDKILSIFSLVSRMISPLLNEFPLFYGGLFDSLGKKVGEGIDRTEKATLWTYQRRKEPALICSIIFIILTGAVSLLIFVPGVQPCFAEQAKDFVGKTFSFVQESFLAAYDELYYISLALGDFGDAIFYLIKDFSVNSIRAILNIPEKIFNFIKEVDFFASELQSGTEEVSFRAFSWGYDSGRKTAEKIIIDKEEAARFFAALESRNEEIKLGLIVKVKEIIRKTSRSFYQRAFAFYDQSERSFEKALSEMSRWAEQSVEISRLTYEWSVSQMEQVYYLALSFPQKTASFFYRFSLPFYYH